MIITTDESPTEIRVEFPAGELLIDITKWTLHNDDPQMTELRHTELFDRSSGEELKMRFDRRFEHTGIDWTDCNGSSIFIEVPAFNLMLIEEALKFKYEEMEDYNDESN